MHICTPSIMALQHVGIQLNKDMNAYSSFTANSGAKANIQNASIIYAMPKEYSEEKSNKQTILRKKN